MERNWECYTYEAMNILIKPNVKETAKELSKRMNISLKDALTVLE